MANQEYKSIKPGEYTPYQPTASDPDVALVRDRIRLFEEEQQLKEAKQQQLAQQTEEGAAEVAKEEAESIEAPVADEPIEDVPADNTPINTSKPIPLIVAGNTPLTKNEADEKTYDPYDRVYKKTQEFIKKNEDKIYNSDSKDKLKDLSQLLGTAIVENNTPGNEIIDLRAVTNYVNEVHGGINTDAVLRAADTAYEKTRPEHYIKLEEQKQSRLVELDAEYELAKDDAQLKSLQDGILTGKNKYSGEYNNSLDLFDRNLAYEKLEASIEADPKYDNYTSKQKEAVINKGIGIIEQKQLMNTVISDNIELKNAIKANKAFKAEADVLASNARITAETAINNYASMLSEKLQKEAQGLDPAQHDELVNKYDLLLQNYQKELNDNNIPKLKKQFEALKEKHGVDESIDIGAELQKGAKELVQEKYDLNYQSLNEYASSIGGFGHMALMNFGGVGGISTAKSILEMGNVVTSNLWDFDISVFDKELNAATALVAPDIDPNLDMSEEIFTPAFWATKGAQTAPLTFALMGTGMGISAGLAALTGSARMAVLQSSALGNMALASVTSRPVESLIEGSQVYSEAIMAGHSVEDAASAAWKVAAFNMPLVVLDAIPFLPLLTKMKAPITKLGAVSGVVGLGIFDAITEAPEEVYQGFLAEHYAHDLKGKKYSFMDHIIDKSTGEFTNQMIEEAALGVGMGIMMGGPATVADLTNLDYLMKEDGNWNNVREYIDGMIAAGHLSGDPESILKAKMSLNTMYNRLNTKKSEAKKPLMDRVTDLISGDGLTEAERKKQESDKFIIDNLDDETYNRAMDYLSVLSDLPAFIESTSNLNASLADADAVFTKGKAVLPTITELEQFKKKLGKYKLITSGGLPEEDKIDEGFWDKLRKNLLMNTQARADYDAKIADKLKNLKIDREQANELSAELIADVDNLTTKGYQLEALITLHKLGLSDKVTEHINALENSNKTVEDLGLAPERVDSAKAALKLLEDVDITGNSFMNSALQQLIKDNPEVEQLHQENNLKNEKVNNLRNINKQIEDALAEANENYRTNPTYKKQALNVINAHLKAKQNVNMYDNLVPKSDRKVESLSKMLLDTLNDLSATTALIKGPSKEGYKFIESPALTNARKEKIDTLNKNKNILEQALEAANAENAQIKEAQRQAQTLYKVNNTEEMLKSLQKDPTTSGKLKDKLDKLAKRLKAANEGAKRTAARLAKKSDTSQEVVEETIEEELPISEEETIEEEVKDLKVGDLVRFIGKGKNNGVTAPIERIVGNKVKLVGIAPLINISNVEFVKTAEEVSNEIHNEVVSTTITEEIDNELTGEGLFNDNVLQTDLEVDEQQGESILNDGKKNLNPVGSVAYLDLNYEEDPTTGKITTISDQSTTLAISALDPSIQVGDKVELRVLTEDEFIPYTDKDGVVYQYQDLVNLANEKKEPFANYMPIGIYHNGKQIGFLHIPSWITPARVPESKVNIAEAKSNLIKLRQLLETEKSITTKITDISLGSIRKNTKGRANTAVTMPDNKIVALIGTKNNQLLDGTQSSYIPDAPVIPNKASKKIQPGLKYMALPVDGKILITPIYDLRVSDYDYNTVNAKQITDTIIEALKVFADGNKQSPLRLLIIDNYDLDITNAQDLEAFIQLFIPTTSITKKNTDLLEASDDGKQFKLKNNGLKNKRAYFGLVPTEKGVFINFINTGSWLTTIDMSKVKDNVEAIRQALLMMRLNSSASRINTEGEFTLVVIQNGKPTEIKYKNYNEYFKSTTETPLTSVKLGETDNYSYFAQRVIQFETPSFEPASKGESTDEVEIITPAPTTTETVATETEAGAKKADIERKFAKNGAFSIKSLTDTIPNLEVVYDDTSEDEADNITTITLRDKTTKKHIASINIAGAIDGYYGVRIQVNDEFQNKGLSKHLYNLALTEVLQTKNGKGLFTVDEMLKTPDKTKATRDNFTTIQNTSEEFKNKIQLRFTNVSNPTITLIEDVSDKFVSKGATKINARYDAKISALNNTAVETQSQAEVTAENPALADVESTAKALEEVDIRNVITPQAINAVNKTLYNVLLNKQSELLSKGIRDFQNNPEWKAIKDQISFSETLINNDTKAISSAYHSAKAKPESERTAQEAGLVQAVEELLTSTELGLSESVAETETPDTEANASINALDDFAEYNSPVLQENNEIIKNNFMGPLAVRAISSQSAFKALKYCKG